MSTELLDMQRQQYEYNASTTIDKVKKKAAHTRLRRFSHCSFNVKLRLFRSFCSCFYDIALWRHVKTTVVDKFKSAYVKCLKMFFNFHKYSSVSDMFLQLGLPTFCTISHNAEWSFLRCKELCSNMLVCLVTKFCVVSP